MQFDEGVLSNSTPKKELSGDKKPTSIHTIPRTTPMQDSPPTGDCITLRSSKPAAPLTRIKRRNIMQLNKGRRKKQRKENIQHNVQLMEADIHQIKSGRMLSDTHIDAANKMLQKQFPETRGLQSPLLGQNLSFPVTEPPFVQILHVGGNHWMTVIPINKTTVKVFDSMFRCVGTCTSMQCAAMLKSNEDHLDFRIESTQLQEGGVDCGLFAIAYATEFCFGNNPECYR